MRGSEALCWIDGDVALGGRRSVAGMYEIQYVPTLGPGSWP